MIKLYFKNLNPKFILTTIIGVFFIAGIFYWVGIESGSLLYTNLTFFFGFVFWDLFAFKLRAIIDYSNIMQIPLSFKNKLKVLFFINIFGYKLLFFIVLLLPYPVISIYNIFFNLIFFVNIIGLYILYALLFTIISLLIRRSNLVFIIFSNAVSILFLIMILVNLKFTMHAFELNSKLLILLIYALIIIFGISVPL